MSKVNENQKVENLEEVKENTETKELAVQEEKKFNFKLGPKMKKGLKIAGVAGLSVLGFLLGVKWGSRNNDNSDDDSDDEYEEVEYEVVDDKNEEE